MYSYFEFETNARIAIAIAIGKPIDDSKTKWRKVPSRTNEFTKYE